MKDTDRSYENRKNRCYCCGRDLSQSHKEWKEEHPNIGCQKCDNLLEKYPDIKYIKVDPTSKEYGSK